MISVAIRNAFAKAKERKWDKTYWAIDIHETVIKPNWSLTTTPTEFYPKAKEILQHISKRADIVMILYTCSHPHEILKYIELFKENDIYFDHINANPEVDNESYGFYDKKPYFNVLLEDKAGFDPYSDWDEVYKILKENPTL